MNNNKSPKNDSLFVPLFTMNQLLVTAVSRISILLIVLVGASGLVGCQGGGSSDQQASVAPEKTDQPITVSNDVSGESIDKTSELQAPDNLSFTSHRPMTLEVDIQAEGTDLAYLSVYSDYAKHDNGGWNINYDSRLLASSMTEPVVKETFSLPQHIKTVLVQVWFYDAAKKPLSWEVSVAEFVAL